MRLRPSTLLLPAAVALALRVAAVLVFDPPLASDPLSYWTMAVGAYDGTGLRNGHELAYMSAGYPLLLAAAFLALGKSLAAAKAVNVVLGTATTLLLTAAAARAFASPRAGLLAGLLWAVYAEGVTYTGYLAKENLTTFLLALTLWATLAALRSPRPAGWGGLLGLAFGATALAGPTGLALVPGALAALALAPAPRRARLAAVALMAVAAALVLAPWLERNQRLLGAPVLNTNAGFNLYIGNNPGTDGHWHPITDTELGPDWQNLVRRLGEVGVDRYARDRALDHMRAHPAQTAGLALRKLALFWEPPWHDGGGAGRERVLRRMWLLQFLLMAALAISAAAAGRRCPEVRLAAAAVALFTLLHAPYYVMPRYRLPIMAAVAVLAGGGGERLLRNWETGFTSCGSRS